MAFEIFIEPELETLADVENAEQWQSICQSLDLKGQKNLVKKDEQVAPPPYMYVDSKTERIIRTLCPRKVTLDEYNASTIPLDVLQEAEKCVKSGWYQGGLHIFYDEQSPDPFLVGFINKNSWDSPKHLIARWGAEMLPFEQLESKAIERLMDQAKKELTMLKNQAEYAIANPVAFVKEVLANGQPGFKMDFNIQDLRW